jgi:peptidoglycan-associated lipoprotein
VALTVGSLMLVSTLAGCAGSSWQFWKKSSSTEAPSEPTVGTSAPTPVAAATPVAVATPPAPPTAMPAPPASDFAELPELRDVRFKPGLVTIGKADVAALDTTVRWLKEHPDSLVRIEGHSDDLGTPAANMVVAEKRAVSVMKYLVSKGLEPGRISIASYGSDRPVCMEKNATCRAKNRRVSILVKQP